LHELGWTDGRNVSIEYRWAEGRTERFGEIAAEFVARKVDVMVTSGVGVPAAMKATSTIPIVFAVAVDPVGSGFVTSLARPGGNVTGLSVQSQELAGKKLEFLREVIPAVRRLAIMANVGYPAAVQEMNEVRAAARTLGIDTTMAAFREFVEVGGLMYCRSDSSSGAGGQVRHHHHSNRFCCRLRSCRRRPRR
jgi:putative tryptophan/tyrosine transport system substrate-binding protein